MTLQPDRARNIMVPPLLAKGTRSRCRFLGGSDTRIIMDFDEAALIRLSHGQNVQMKCQRSLGVISEDPRHTRAHVAKSVERRTLSSCDPFGASTLELATDNGEPLQTNDLRDCRPEVHEACAILWQKLYARFSEYALEQGNRVPVFRVATRLVIHDPVSMQTGRLSQVPNRPIQRSTRHPEFVQLSQARTVPMSHVTTSSTSLPRRRIKGGSSELQLI